MGIPATGNRVAVEAIHIFRFEGGRMAEHWVARDDLGMMRQLAGPGALPASEKELAAPVPTHRWSEASSSC
jgi:hypothetical protein